MVSNSTISNNKTEDLNDVFLSEALCTWSVLPEDDTRTDESVSVVDGVNVLARVQGPFFLVNGVSRNNRFYSERLWTNTISKVQEKLGKGGLFGAIGHDQPLDEKALAEGKFSHTVSKLWIDKETMTGMGEILVLGTNSGKQLNVLLRAGMPLPVSSRAYGKSKGKTAMGEDIIDEDSFHLETFDFVLNPGVSSALVHVVENVPPTQQEEVVMTETKLEEKLEILQKLTEEKNELQAKVAEVLEAHLASNARATELEKTIKAYESAVGTPEAAKELNREVSEGLRKWLELPVLKEYALAAGLLDQGASAPSASQFISKMLGLTETYAGLGSVEDIKALKESNKAFSALGSVEDITKVLDVLEQYSKLGKVAELTTLIGVYESFTRLGTPEEITTQLEKGKKLAEQVLESKRKAASNKIAAEFNVAADAVLEMVKKMGVEATVENLKKIKESTTLSSVYKVSPTKVEEKVVKSPSASTLTSKFFESSTPKDSTPVPETATPRASL